MSALIPEVLVFGSDDYVADIGAVRTKSASELLYARQKMVNSDQFLREILFLCNGIRWPLFLLFTPQLTVLINYLCGLDTTLRNTEHMFHMVNP